MVDRSRRSGCRHLCTREELVGGVLPAAESQRHTAGKGSDRGPTLVEVRERLVVASEVVGLVGPYVTVVQAVVKV